MATDGSRVRNDGRGRRQEAEGNADRSQEVQNTSSLVPTRLQSETQSRVTR